MRARRSIASSGLVVLVASLLVSCESSGGIRRQICGEWIGSPASGDQSIWYVNMSEQHSTTVRAWLPWPYESVRRDISITNLQVSKDCEHGATVSVSDDSILRVKKEINATDSSPVVVIVTPRRVGRATVTAVQAGATPSTVTFIVRQRRF